MIILLCLYYIRCSQNNYEMFLTLGMDTKVYYSIRIMESVFGFLITGIIGGVCGYIFLRVTVLLLEKVSDLSFPISKIGISVYMKSIFIVGIVFLFSCMATRDLWQSLQFGNSANKRELQERMPIRFLKSGVMAGCVLCLLQIYRFSKIYNYESVVILGFFIIGLFLVFRYGLAVFLRKERQSTEYLYKLLQHNRLWNKSLTSVGYFLVLMTMQFFVMFLFPFHIVTTMLAENADELYPYDAVCIADDKDMDLFQELQKDYKVTIEDYPMVRVTNYDTTESLESPQQQTIQGQQIGISESTYHVLKKRLNADYEPADLNLDGNGESIYIVHQQDKSTKAQPTDFWMHSKSPLLHIGQPCTGVSHEMALRARKMDVGYYFKKVEGEEIGSLIGCFGEGIKENIIVFSDEYFAKAKDFWKTRNIYTGREIKNPEERIEDVTIRQGPTKLVLITGITEKNRDEVKEILEIFRERHSYDESYDSSVQPYYLKQEAMEYTIMKRVIQTAVNMLMIGYFFITGMFLFSVKLLTEQKENRERDRFLCCIGMDGKERKRLVFHENNKFHYVPLVAAWLSAFAFMLAVFRARMYSTQMMVHCLTFMFIFWGSYFCVNAIATRIILLFYIQKLKGDKYGNCVSSGKSGKRLQIIRG